MNGYCTQSLQTYVMRQYIVCSIFLAFLFLFSLVQAQFPTRNQNSPMNQSSPIDQSFEVAQEPCGTMLHRHHQLQNDPLVVQNYALVSHQQNDWIRKNGENYRAGGITTIPVVVHVVYLSQAQNISDAHIQSQLDILNEDFRRLNADTVNTPSAFAPLMADCQIEFCLARRDPDGNPTTGIIRKQTYHPTFGMLDNVKFDSTGGSDAWPRDQYLNIWVCNLFGGLYGYAQFPGGPAATDGIVVDYLNFGDINVLAPFDLGRTATHEVGHWLGLYHTWGDDNGSCGGNDNVADTPNQADYSLGCPSFPLSDNCSPNTPGVMFMNYMDYSDDACSNGFTQGQSAVMQSVLSTSRQSILNSDGCVLPLLPPTDAAVQEITAPIDSSCASSITPEFVLFNWGMDTLTSLDLNWQIDAGTIQTQTWTGSLPSLSGTTISLPPQNINVGGHSLTIFTSDPNGTLDGNTLNDTLNGIFVIQSPSPGDPPPFFRDFEPQGFPPAGISIDNPDLDGTWEKSLFAGAGNSSYAALIFFYGYELLGEHDRLNLPIMDFSNGSSPNLSFDLSYRKRGVFHNGDTLKVEISTDCGATWGAVYEKAGFALATTLPNFTTQSWQPTSASDWRNEFVDLSAYAGMSGVWIRFLAVNGYGNNLYLDNINVMGAVAVDDQLQAGTVTISPNPGRDRYRVDMLSDDLVERDISVLNALGEEIGMRIKVEPGVQQVSLDLTNEPAGVYFVRVATRGTVVIRKLIHQ